MLIAETSGERLDKFIVQHRPDLTRSRVQQMIGEGAVRVNDALRKSNYLVHAGDRVELEPSPAKASQLVAQPIELKVTFEDEDLIVIDKPAGMVVHPAHGHAEGTLVNALLYHAPGIVIGETERPGIVHRLDRDTSGLILVAKNDMALQSLQKQFQARTIEKIYFALVHGRPAAPRGRIVAAVGRDPHDRKRMSVVGESSRGRPAETEYAVIAAKGDHALLKLWPKTGRTHQIRVHLASLGHPIMGDRLYGHKALDPLANRQLLHAWRLAISHPRTGRREVFSAPLPYDFAYALVGLGIEPSGGLERRNDGTSTKD